MTQLEFISLVDLVPIIPEIIVLITACTVLLVDLFAPQKDRAFTLAVTTIIGLLLAIFVEVSYGKILQDFMVPLWRMTFQCFELIYLSVAIVTVFISRHYIAENEMNFGEYYASYCCFRNDVHDIGLDLLVIFIGLEIMSISSYILVGIKRKVARANEAAKIFVTGAFSDFAWNFHALWSNGQYHPSSNN